MCFAPDKETNLFPHEGLEETWVCVTTESVYAQIFHSAVRVRLDEGMPTSKPCLTGPRLDNGGGGPQIGIFSLASL